MCAAKLYNIQLNVPYESTHSVEKWASPSTDMLYVIMGYIVNRLLINLAWWVEVVHIPLDSPVIELYICNEILLYLQRTCKTEI